MNYILAILVLAALMLGACTEKQVAAPKASAWESEVSEAIVAHPFLDEMPKIVAKVPYEEIALEKTPCFGGCLAYRVIFRKDGSAILVNDPQVESKRVVYDGRIDLRAYARAALMVENARRESEWSNYSAHWTDDSTAIVKAGSRDLNWEVSDYGEVSPLAVWSLVRALQSLKDETKWEVRKGE